MTTPGASREVPQVSCGVAHAPSQAMVKCVVALKWGAAQDPCARGSKAAPVVSWFHVRAPGTDLLLVATPVVAKVEHALERVMSARAGLALRLQIL